MRYEICKETVKWEPYLGKKRATENAYERAQMLDFTEKFKVLLINTFKELRI